MSLRANELADLGSVHLGCDRPRRRHPVAAARGQARFKELTDGPHRGDGPAHLGVAAGEVRPLPGRRNVVLTRQADYVAEGAEVVTSLEDALAGRRRVGDRRRRNLRAGAAATPTRCEVTEVDIDLPPRGRRRSRAGARRAWVAEDGDWQASSSGLRYRFSSYRGDEAHAPIRRAGWPSRLRVSPSRSRAARSPGPTCAG